jgi:probable phosphoglycerate mutase
VRLILVRHGLPHRTSGPGDEEPPSSADPGLTELGRRQAARVAEVLRDLPIAALCVSPLRRARETAAPLAAALGLRPEVLPGLAEYDAEATHYIPVHQMPEADPAGWARILAGQLPPGVDVPAFRARVTSCLDGVAERHPGPVTVVGVAHAGVINIYLAELLGLARPLTFPLDYAGLTRVSVSRAGRRSVRTVNEIAHVLDLLDAR